MVRLRESLNRQIAVRPGGDVTDTPLQWRRQVLDVASGENGLPVLSGI